VPTGEPSRHGPIPKRTRSTLSKVRRGIDQRRIKERTLPGTKLEHTAHGAYVSLTSNWEPVPNRGIRDKESKNKGEAWVAGEVKKKEQLAKGRLIIRTGSPDDG